MSMVIHNDFNFGEQVFLKTDPDQYPRMVVQMGVQPTGTVTYRLASGDSDSWHHSIEMSREKNPLIQLNN